VPLENILEDIKKEKVGKYIEIQHGYAFSSKDFSDSGIPVIKIQNVSDPIVDVEQINSFYDNEIDDKIRKFIVKNNDLLISMTGSKITQLNSAVGKVSKYASKKIALLNQRIGKIIITDEHLNSKYLYQFMLTSNVHRYLAVRATGSAQQANINSKLIESLLIPIPPLVEQRGIAEVLETVDEIIRVQERVIEKTELLKQELMQKLLTEGIGHTEYKDTPLGRIPEIWTIERLRTCLERCEYGLNEALSEKGKYPVFRMNNIKNGLMVDNGLKYLNLDDESFAKYEVKKGDILFNRTNSYELVGKVGIYLLEGKHVYASYLIRLRTKKHVDSKYLNYYLNLEQTQNVLRKLASRGVSQSNINAKSLQSIYIPVPSYKEQNEIVSIIESIDNHILLETMSLTSNKEIKRGLMQVLLSGEKRVEFDGNRLVRIN
jgi:type I restriction enzyme, S subunit